MKVPFVTISIDDSDSQVPFSAPSFYPDPEHPMDSYVADREVDLLGDEGLVCPQEGPMTHS